MFFLHGRECRHKALPEHESSALFSERERAALTYAEAMTYTDRFAEAEHFDRLGLYFSDNAVLELTALVAFQNLSSKFNAALGIEAQGLCAVATSPANNDVCASVEVHEK